MIKCSNVSFRYPNGQGIHDINVSIEPGSIYLLAGMNGSGKSTLLKVLAGGLTEYTGTITVNNIDLKDSSIRKKRMFTVALSPQQPETQFSLPTVRDELRFTANAIKQPVDSGMEAELLDMLDLKPYLDASPFDLPPVKRKLLSLAIAGVIPSPFIALDEPTAGIDNEHKPMVLKFVGFLHKHNKGVIIVSHDIDTFLPMSTHVCIMHDGMMKESIGTQSLLKKIEYGEYEPGLIRPFIIPRLAILLTNKPALTVDELAGKIIN